MMMLLGLVDSLGCRGRAKINRKSIGDLYSEALRDTQSRPAVIRPNPIQHYIAKAASKVDQATEVAASTAMPAPIAIPPLGPPPLMEHLASLQPFSDDPTNRPDQYGQVVPASTALASTGTGDLRYRGVSGVTNAVALNIRDQELINEVFDQTDVREAIQVLATNSKQTIVVDDTIGGVTSVQINNATFDMALAKVLAPLGLYFAKIEDTYFVAPADPDSPMFTKIAKRDQYSPINHDVKGLISLLPPRFKKFVSSSDTRNLILVDAPPEIGNEILERIRELDTPVPQIELEAIVCVVAPDSGFRFGLDWNHVVGVNGVDSLKAGLTGLTFSGSASQAGARNAFSDFAVTSAFVKLLAQEGYVTIRAAPRVTTKDGEKANISINRETFFSLQNTASSAFFSPNIQKVEAGINLDITPRVHGEMISVQITKAEVSEDIRSSDTRAELTSNPYPIINRRTVSTNVNVPEGHTIVIGGLVQRQTVERINRIPVLSRIPLAGRLFQTIEKQEQDAEVAIFISPKLVIDNYAYRDAPMLPPTVPSH
jgi:type IV pilus assembly protein PilQ